MRVAAGDAQMRGLARPFAAAGESGDDSACDDWPDRPHGKPSAPALRQLSQAARVPARLSGAIALTAVGGCAGVQSALDGAGRDAGHLEILSVVLFTGGTAIFLFTTALLLYALFAAPERRAWLGTRRTVIAGGIVFPIVTLTLIFVYGLVLLRVTHRPGENPLRIEVVGEQYWWRVTYAPDGDAPGFTTANEFQVPVGRPIEVSVTSTDVIHSFWIPNFAGKVDMIPGRVNRLTFEVGREGVYRGQCTEFCGDQHARMAIDALALSPAAFDAWRAAQGRPAREPAIPVLEEGKALFTRAGCGNCHAVRGTDAVGHVGPDLTHIGSRRSIGAAQFPNNIGTLAGWIADTQHLKAGVRMPSYGSFNGPELRALAGYLESLK
jgi:cytochrome c oxidase subunit 2